MLDQGLTGTYTMVDADVEMLISHGVAHKSSAPSCRKCHNLDSRTPDDTKMLPFATLGYHTWPAMVENFILCHSAENINLEELHAKHEQMVTGKVQLP